MFPNSSFSTSLSVSDLNPSQDRQRQSQPGSNLSSSFSRHDSFSGSGWGSGNLGGLSNSQSQYIPGYLMSASQGKALPGSPSSPQTAPLIPEPFPRSTSNAAFGSEALLATQRLNSPRTNVAHDDEDAPPTTSLMDFAMSSPEPVRTNNFSSSGFHSQTASAASPSHHHSQSHSHQQQQPQHQSSSESYPVIIFGFPPEKAKAIVGHFASMGDGASVELGPEGSNWASVAYRSAWEAARAVRHNGEIVGGSVMVGVKWANAAQGEALAASVSTSGTPALPAPGTNLNIHTPTPSRRSTLNTFSSMNSMNSIGSIGPSATQPDLSMSVSSSYDAPNRAVSVSTTAAGPGSFSMGRQVTLAPSASAFKRRDDAAGSTRSVDWGLLAQQKAAAEAKPAAAMGAGAGGAGGGAGQAGVLGKISDIIFGW
ncbi:hypothetical protein BOTBODRAFT_28150 [Botryobasidium botryosum FD-172 SS1]|uniref:RRM Nup35-type domain-containing protein n=1 Tax=Botryobasidium botryosum (strain FD-172 SS1) TaxID=930990 RepID=A0A067MUZ3_BOTB1|nr:hypothetical protein BOTBODRAFT_28150 [Botryobasidium botryosum FD-172 SS1]